MEELVAVAPEDGAEEGEGEEELQPRVASHGRVVQGGADAQSHLGLKTRASVSHDLMM